MRPQRVPNIYSQEKKMRKSFTLIRRIAVCAIAIAPATSALAGVNSAWLFKYEDYEQTSHAAPTTPVYNAFYPYVEAGAGDNGM